MAKLTRFQRSQNVPIKKRRAKQDRYKIDTYVVDGIDNNDYVVHSSAKTLKGARAEARKTESYERRTYDHSFVHIDSAISANKKRYRIKKGNKR